MGLLSPGGARPGSPSGTLSGRAARLRRYAYAEGKVASEVAVGTPAVLTLAGIG